MVFGPSVYDVPLLPYERQLIATIGLSEEEYRKFAAEVRRRGTVRPAEYAHIPDVKATGFEPFLIQLAIGLVLTGAAYLLTPKPKAPEASKRTQLDLGSTNAANRFTPSRGFDSLMELADYGSPIPIIFGRYIKSKKVGGLLATPKLVWSRMLSHGTQQSAKLMFVVGEHGHADGTGPDGIIEPDLEGIFLGNNALDALFEDFFAFYWKRNSPMLTNGFVDSASGFNRLTRNNLFYGSAGDGSKGDPFQYATEQDVFECPNQVRSDSKSFCHAYSPANNTDFGTYGSLPNGTGFKLNWEVVSIIDGTDQQQRHASAIRRWKIAGAKRDDSDAPFSVKDEGHLVKIRKMYMEGEGRQYSPRMGLTKLVRANGSVLQPDFDALTERDKIEVGDTVEFTIRPGGVPEDIYQRSNNRGGEPVDDINSTVESEQLAADDALQVGEQFAIGNVLFVVQRRKLQQFDPDKDKEQVITLRCISTKESQDARIGFVNDDKVVQPEARSYVRDGDTLRKWYVADKEGVRPTFYPITRIAAAVVRNNKPAVVTEVGIRSKVFQRLQGLAAFNSTPTPDELDKFDDEEVQVRAGTYTGNITRTSVFQVYVRKAGVDNGDNAFSFRRMDLLFAVRGNSPAEQYNFIRFKHPQKTELEYKFVPIAGAELANLDDDQKIILLSASISDANSPSLVRKPQVGNLGKFIVETAGVELRKKDIQKNKEFLRKPKKVVGSDTKSIPSAVEHVSPRPDEKAGVFRRAISIEIGESNGNLDPPGRQGTFMWEIFGNPDNDGGGVGTQRSKETREVFGDRWIRIRWTVQKNELVADHYARVGQGQIHVWALAGYAVTGSSPRWGKGDIFFVRRGEGSTAAEGEPGYGNSAYGSENKFRGNHPSGSLIRWSGWYFRVTDIETTSVPEGRSGGYYYEVFGDAESEPLGKTKSATKAIQEGNKKIRFRLNAKVVQLPSGHFTGLTKKWELNGPIEIVDDGYTNAAWDKGDTFEHLETINASNNPFYWTYDRVGFQYRINDVGVVPGTGTFTGETEFERDSQYADISFYRGLVQKSNDNEPEHKVVYVNEILENSKVPEYNGLTICGLSLKASRNFTSLDSLRVWLGQGIPVRRLHPDVSSDNNNPYDESGDTFFKETYGPSHLFTDLAFYLLTDKQGGAGNLTGMSPVDAFLLNVEDFKDTSRFIHKQELFFNGVIAERTNLRQYIMDVAPFFLCNFVMSDGKFSLLPAIPAHKKSGNINDGPVPIDQLFTAGNILEDSYKVEYLRSEERRDFSATVRYRFESRNKLPEERVMKVKVDGSQKSELPEEQFDLTQFCTSRDHALKVAKYFLGLRKFVTHTISFSTTVEGLNLKAGSYIKVITESSPYTSAQNGVVSSTGVVTSVEPIADGTYNVTFYKTSSDDIEGGDMQITDGKVSDTKFHDSVFSINKKETSAHVYVVEQLTFSEEGTVDILASEHQCNDDRHSKLAKFIKDPDSVKVEDIQ